MTRPGLYGLMAEFSDPSEVVAAARKVHEAGYRRVDAFNPFAGRTELRQRCQQHGIVYGAVLGVEHGTECVGKGRLEML